MIFVAVVVLLLALVGFALELKKISRALEKSRRMEEPQTLEGWQQERAATVRTLRDICEHYGDQDWPDDLYLPDVIEKHLRRHLEQ